MSKKMEKILRMEIENREYNEQIKQMNDEIKKLQNEQNKLLGRIYENVTYIYKITREIEEEVEKNEEKERMEVR